LHETGRATDDVMIRVTQIMTPEPETEVTDILPEEVSQAIVAKAVPDQSKTNQAKSDHNSAQLPVPEEPARQEAAVQPGSSSPQATEARPPLPDPPASAAEPANEPGKTAEQEPTPEKQENEVQVPEEQIEAEVPEPSESRDKIAITSEKIQRFPEFPKSASKSGEAVELPADDYVTTYTHWRKSGAALDDKSTLVPLRIQNLEKVYRLFQMKVVAVREGVPYLDLTDNSRVAPDALSGYSTTCFVVSRPWEKWGEALERAGFTRNDTVEVRYYTYDFVRNAIYSRAMKAFDWSLSSGSLPTDTPPESADVLGKAYAVKQAGGGAFGVFVPVRVDFNTGASVAVDALDCFEGAPDIAVLKQAGVL
ncbi:MAG: hypothetical protein MI802_05470, partial [Desulfobacterales bacterium]|nr:hypothetical protein [Desulfobacterales bacterium]